MQEGRLLDDEAKAELTSRILAEKARIEIREPDHLRVLQVECLNEIIVRHGGHSESDDYIKLSFLQRRLKHFFDWRPHTLFSNAAKREAAKLRSMA